jgi:hypothetical protein
MKSPSTLHRRAFIMLAYRRRATDLLRVYPVVTLLA